MTSDEKSKLSSISPSKTFNFKTSSNFFSVGAGVGLDLYIFEISGGLFLMYYDANLKFRACKQSSYNYGDGIGAFFPDGCEDNPKDVINITEHSFSGFGFGRQLQFSLVFLETDNWRISIDETWSNILKYYDSSFKPVSYRGLNYFSTINTNSWLSCDGYTKSYYNTSTRVNDCTNSKGEDMSRSSDWTGGLKITYYFR